VLDKHHPEVIRYFMGLLKSREKRAQFC